MTRLVAAVLLAAACATNAPAQAAEHHCAADAREQARRLLVFHTETDRPVQIDEDVRVLPSLANPAAPKQRFDVLETWGHLYKAKYRIRLLYAQVPGPCVLMGQEILEHARL
jgi:hypothetical protein